MDLKIINTDFLRMWMHCPVQACWCLKQGLLPIDLLAHRCAAQAIHDACPEKKSSKPFFDSAHVKDFFDKRWTSVQASTNLMSPDVFLDLGKKYVDRLFTISIQLNTLISEGWNIVGGNVEISDTADNLLSDEALSNWKIVHNVDCLLRNPQGMLCFITIYLGTVTRFNSYREIRRSADNLLNSLMALSCLDEPALTVILTSTKKGMIIAQPQEADKSLACSLLTGTIRGLIGKSVTHTNVNQLNCNFCPTQDSCDDHISYESLLQEDLL